MADGALHFVATQDNRQVIASLEQMRQGFSQMASAAQQSGTELDGTFEQLKSTIAKTAGSIATIGTAMELSKKIATVRGEFQQLEIAFSTMLGSGEKANKLMTQLTQTAAKTPFDLKGVANGAKQLLAYGIAADDVNDTLIHLGDIAAGLSIPLNDMVMLYGTTMVQGRMFTQDLRQFQGRGVPLMEALANTMGVTKDAVTELVSQGKVGAAEFQTALTSLTAEGGKFGGLMNEQSKSITGQISNIQDGIDMMFNEIGQKSEGAINTALSGVSKLVENYETVGTAVLAIAGTYGTYRAALVLVSAVEKAHTNMLKAAVLEKNLASAANITLSNSDAMAAARKSLFTKTIKLNTQAVLKNTAAMLTNPAVLITAGLVALCATVYAVTKALNTQARAQERVNELNEQQKEQREQTKNEADQAIATIQSETATIYEKAKAYQTLQKIMPQLTEQYTQAQIANLKLSDAQKAVATNIESLEFEQKAQEIAKTTKTIEDYEKQLEIMQSMPNGGGAGIGVVANKLATEKKVLEQLRKEYNAMLKLREQALFDAQPAEVKIAKFTADKNAAQEQLDALQLQAEKAAAKAKAAWESNPLNQWKISVGITFEQEAANDQSLLGGEYNMLQPLIKGLQRQIQETDNQLQSLSANTSKQTLPQLISDILAAEKNVEQARKTYANDMNDTNKSNVENAEASLKTLTDDYKTATNTAWVDTKSMYENIAKARQQALNERQQVMNSTIQAERAQREANYWQTIKEINQEEAAYKKAHNGRTSSEFDLKRENATMQFDIDMSNLDKDFEEWKRTFERETMQIKVDMQTDEEQNALNNAQSVAEQIQRQNELYQKQIELKKQANQQEADDEVRNKYGDATLTDFRAFSADKNNQAILSSFRNATGVEDKKKAAEDSGLSEALLATYSEIEQIYEAYAKRLDLTIQQTTQQHNADMLQQDLDRYTSYLDQTLTLEEQYQKQLADIRAQYGLAEDADLSQYGKDTAIGRDVAAATTERDRAQEIVNRDTNIGGKDTKWVEDLANLGADVAGKAMEEVRAIYDQFIKTVEQQIQTTTQERNTAQANITAEKDFQATAEQQLTDVNAQLSTENLPPEEQQALLEQRAVLEQQIAESKERQAAAEAAMTGSQQTLNQLTQVRGKAESAAANATSNASTKTQKQMQKTKRTTASLVDAFAAVKDSANTIADTFGGVLSKKAKKGLQAVSDVSDAAMTTINAISYVATNASTLMAGTAEGAAGAIRTVETASVILTIISLALQVIQAIVKVASQFTTSAQMQEAIDNQLEKVDELKKRHEKMERSYKDKSGTEYYKGLAKSAKDYDTIIAANNKALQQAADLYEYQKNRYGEDSDKAKEAKEQMEDIENSGYDLEDAQKEQYDQLLEDLSGTNLQSFSESLADALIEGFAQGREGIDDVWEDTMDDLMRTMMKQQLALAIQDMFDDTFKKLNNLTSNGDLTQSEIDSIMSEFDAQSEKAKYLAEKYYDLMSERGLLDDADAEGSEGFGQMTQDTADALNARFTALQMEGANVVEAAQTLVTAVADLGADSKLQVASLQTLMYNSGIALQVAQEQLDQLQVIADNTALLADTNDRLKAIQQNTSRL